MDLQKYFKLINKDCEGKFEKFYELLDFHNKMYNLTAICGKEEVFLKHFLDSAAGESFFKEGAKVVEIGSGGGFPSIPLKIIREDLDFFLIESTGKKCIFLDCVVDNLNLSGVKVENARAEEAARRPELREKFDCATARAVARLNVLCEYCLPFVKKGGRFIAYKGDCDEEVKEAENAVKILGGRIDRVEKYSLPNGDRRSLIIIEKTGSTPLKYPRGNGKERKQPL